MTRVLCRTIAWATRSTASCAVRFGRYPNDPGWKSASKIGSSISLSAPCTTRGDREDADLAAILRNLPPPCRQRHIGAPLEFVPDPLEERFNALRLDGREGHPVYARGTIVVLRQRIRSTQRFHLADVDVQTPKRQDVSAFALTYSLRLRSCRLMDAFVISSLPSRLMETLQTAGPLCSAGITPRHHSYGPIRHPLAVNRLPG